MAHAQQVVTARSLQEKAPPAPAAEPDGGSVHRMVILEGPNRRVHYIPTGNLSSSDRQAASNLERAENELAYLSDLNQLKQEYVRSERMLEPHRRAVQLELYGRHISTSNYASSYVGYSPYSYYGYPGGLYGYYGAGQPAMYNPFFYGHGGNGRGGLGSFASSGYSEQRGLQYGMGDEGRMKAAIVHVIASQYTPDYAAAAAKNYQSALDAAAASSVLSRDLGLTRSKKTTTPPKQ
jgi:hypothetical protein